MLSDLELTVKLTEDLDDKQQEMIVRETFIGGTSEILSKQTLTIVFVFFAILCKKWIQTYETLTNIFNLLCKLKCAHAFLFLNMIHIIVHANIN